MAQITRDTIYDAVAPDDFGAMLDVTRHEARSTAFDKIIAAKHDHYWNPLDKRYIDFSPPWDMVNEALQPDDLVPALQTDYVEAHFAARPPQERIRFINEVARWQMSAILHGEQGGLRPPARMIRRPSGPGGRRPHAPPRIARGHPS